MILRSVIKRRLLERFLATVMGREGLVGARNLAIREASLESALKTISAGSRILDAGAGELK